MTIAGGRAKRPDDWPSSHVRAREDLSDRLDLPLEATEARWLDEHLGACPDCVAIADSYAAQRLELRALRDRMPPPPRDLWARTSAAHSTKPVSCFTAVPPPRRWTTPACGSPTPMANTSRLIL